MGQDNDEVWLQDTESLKESGVSRQPKTLMSITKHVKHSVLPLFDKYVQVYSRVFEDGHEQRLGAEVCRLTAPHERAKDLHT